MRLRAISRSMLVLLMVGLRSTGRSEEPRWLDVPYVHQAEQGCGAASVAMVMQYWMRSSSDLDAASADGDRIYRLLAPDSSQGISGQALQKYLEQHGFSAFIIGAEPADLRQHLSKGRPLIVALALKGPRAPLHYAVAVGIDDRSVILNDPARGKLVREDLPRFWRAWKSTGNWALLAVPRQGQ